MFDRYEIDYTVPTLISLKNVEVGINVGGAKNAKSLNVEVRINVEGGKI